MYETLHTSVVSSKWQKVKNLKTKISLNKIESIICLFYTIIY